ncbi:MAG: hypothetical protein M0P57_04515 [Syntrophales bacterium]|jgi:hypothetical protein|nr:hypothetical protein [Syntrophales bacterium]MDY0043887.1 hypothetical protein [Syntrophales bacterium]
MKKFFSIVFCILFFTFSLVVFASAAEKNNSAEVNERGQGPVCSQCTRISCPLSSVIIKKKKRKDFSFNSPSKPAESRTGYPEQRQNTLPLGGTYTAGCTVDFLKVRYTLWESCGLMGILGYNRLSGNAGITPPFDIPDYTERIFGGIMIVYKF